MSLCKPSFKRGRSGFTLIEILVASIASVLILVAIYGVFQRAFKLRDHATDRVRETRLRTRAANVIRDDLRNGYISTTGTLPGFACTLEGGRTSQKSSFPGYLRFSTTTGKDAPEPQARRESRAAAIGYGDVQQVEYYISDGAKTGDGKSTAGTLVRAVTRDLLNPLQSVDHTEQILSRVESMEAWFFDGQNWLESWQVSESSPALPEAIRLRIQQAPASDNESKPAPLEILVPWTTEPLTSGATSTTGTSAL